MSKLPWPDRLNSIVRAVPSCLHLGASSLASAYRVIGFRCRQDAFAASEHKTSLEARLLRQRDSFDESHVFQMTHHRRHSMPTQAPAWKLGGIKFDPKVCIFTTGPMRASQGSRRHSGRGSETDKPQVPQLWRAVFGSRGAACPGRRLWSGARRRQNPRQCKGLGAREGDSLDGVREMRANAEQLNVLTKPRRPDEVDSRLLG